MTESLEAQERRSAEGATAPRVSYEDIKANIAEVYYLSAGVGLDSDICEHYRAKEEVIPEAHPLDLLTLCFVVTKNGFTIVGKSAPASPENYDPEKGREFAYEDAIEQLWPLMGYALREKLAHG